jgi:ubiquitin thioesterase OTU1
MPLRLRIRGPTGQSAVSLPDDASVGDLKNEITKATSITTYDLKIFDRPPRHLSLAEYDDSEKLAEIDIKLSGEQVIVSERASIASQAPEAPGGPSTSNPKLSPAVYLAAVATKDPIPQRNDVQVPPLSSTRKEAPMDTPEIPVPSHCATMVLRVMPDDNSCMFRAFNSAYFSGMDNMRELRSVIAQTIQAQPETYTKAILERDPDDYCRWIQTSDAWGGAIELGILSKHFDLEICSVDVQTLRVDRFNEGQLQRCFLVYSGVHYDVLALSPSDPPFDKAYAPPEFDTKIFDSHDSVVMTAAIELCRKLQGQHYFTDTAGFTIRCNVCGGEFVGEKGATEHAKKTGHYDFGESG